MIRRPCNQGFHEPVLAEIKETTIRDKPWPIGVPIMLFYWLGKPYRSKQVNIAPVIVRDATSIDISRDADDNITFSEIMGLGRPLWQTEGFNSRAELDAWFRKLVPQGQTVTKILMRFRLMTCGDSDSYFQLHGKLP